MQLSIQAISKKRSSGVENAGRVVFTTEGTEETQRFTEKSNEKKGGYAHLNFTANEDIGEKDFFEIACRKQWIRRTSQGHPLRVPHRPIFSNKRA